MESSFIPRTDHGIMGDPEEDLASFSSSDDEGGTESISSSSDESLSEEEGGGPLFEMSNLIAQLPFKRGLSKHFQGKSQSFSSLSDVRIVEDLAKPENTYKKKKLIASKSYGGALDYSKSLSCAKIITKKTARGLFSSLRPRRNGVLGGSRTNLPSLRSSGDLSGQALLFA